MCTECAPVLLVKNAIRCPLEVCINVLISPEVLKLGISVQISPEGLVFK